MWLSDKSCRLGSKAHSNNSVVHPFFGLIFILCWWSLTGTWIMLLAWWWTDYELTRHFPQKISHNHYSRRCHHSLCFIGISGKKSICSQYNRGCTSNHKKSTTEYLARPSTHNKSSISITGMSISSRGKLVSILCAAKIFFSEFYR
jgi:hypothetical protein